MGITKTRSGRVEVRRPPAARRALGDRQPDRPIRSYPHNPTARQGATTAGRLVLCRRYQEWKTIQARPQDWQDLGRRTDREGRLACREGIRRQSRNCQTGATRSSENVCEALPCGRRRVGANTVSAGPRFRTDDGTILGLQAANPRGRERSYRHRADQLMFEWALCLERRAGNQSDGTAWKLPEADLSATSTQAQL